MNRRLNQLFNKVRKRTDFIIYAHLLNPLWHSRLERRRRRDQLKKDVVQKYLEIYESEIASFSPSPNKANSEDKVFTLWFQGEENAPEIVKACFRSMKKNLKQEVIILDESSLFEWITLPEYIIKKWKSGKIGPAHFSDICRVELLYQYGGYWIDSTAFVTSSIPSIISESDFFVYGSGKKIGGWYSFIQNCFIRARKGNQLLAIWRDAIFLYWKYENKAINYYIHQLIFEFIINHNQMAKELYKAMPKIDQDPTHVLWYGHKDDTFDKKKFEEYISQSFFQKTTYKNSSAKNPLPNSIAEYILEPIS